jgi:hypothetical protein
MSTCNWLDLQTLGSQPIMPKNLPEHWCEVAQETLKHRDTNARRSKVALEAQKQLYREGIYIHTRNAPPRATPGVSPFTPAHKLTIGRLEGAAAVHMSSPAAACFAISERFTYKTPLGFLCNFSRIFSTTLVGKSTEGNRTELGLSIKPWWCLFAAFLSPGLC